MCHRERAHPDRPARPRDHSSCHLDGRPAPTCAYRLTHARRAGFLNVRSGAGLRFRQIGRLRVADGRLPRARAPIKGWIKVKAADDKHDWASAHYLRKITK